MSCRLVFGLLLRLASLLPPPPLPGSGSAPSHAALPGHRRLKRPAVNALITGRTIPEAPKSRTWPISFGDSLELSRQAG